VRQWMDDNNGRLVKTAGRRQGPACHPAAAYARGLPSPPHAITINSSLLLAGIYDLQRAPYTCQRVNATSLLLPPITRETGGTAHLLPPRSAAVATARAAGNAAAGVKQRPRCTVTHTATHRASKTMAK